MTPLDIKPKSSTGSPLGSNHWYRTLLGSIRDMGLFMMKEPEKSIKIDNPMKLDIPELSSVPAGIHPFQYYGKQIAAKAEELLNDPHHHGTGVISLVASYQDSRQISEDHWEVYNRMLKCNENTTLGEILAWYAPNGTEQVKSMQVVINLLENPIIQQT